MGRREFLGLMKEWAEVLVMRAFFFPFFEGIKGDEPHFYLRLPADASNREWLEHLRLYGLSGDNLEEGSFEFRQSTKGVMVKEKPRKAPWVRVGIGEEMQKGYVTTWVEPLYLVFNEEGREVWHQPNGDAWMLAGFDRAIFVHRDSPLGRKLAILREGEHVSLYPQDNLSQFQLARVRGEEIVHAQDQFRILLKAERDGLLALIICYPPGDPSPLYRRVIWAEIEKQNRLDFFSRRSNFFR